MEKRDLTEYLSQETMLRLTEEAFSQQTKKQKVRSFPRWAALAACLALVVMAVNFDTVYAAVQGLLYFLPGKGPVAEQTFPDYWLPTQEYTAHTEEADYFVAYLYRSGDTLSLRVKKEIPNYVMPPEPEEMPKIASGEPSGTGQQAPEAVADMIALVIKDEDGVPVTFLGDSHRSVFAVHDETQGSAQVEVEWEFTGCTLERFTLELDGVVEFPVELQKIAPEDYSVAGGTTVRDAGYALTLLPLNQNCSRFAILTVLEEDGNAPSGSYWNPLTFGLTAIGESGTSYEAETVNSRPGCQEFYLPELPEEQITYITVTGILESTRYDEKKRPTLRLPALELGEMDAALYQQLSLWNDTLTAEAAGLTQEGELWVRFRCQEPGRRLNQIDLEWKEGRLPSQRTTMEEDGRYTTSALEMADRAGKKTTLPISFISVVQEGRWEFLVP